MAVPINPVKTALREGRVQIGLWQALANAYTAEICAGAGFDWLMFDGEHVPNDIPLLLAQLQAVAPYPVHPCARVPAGETHLIKQYLDIGFSTLLIPLVESADQAAHLVRACRYPPHGVRGVGTGLARAARWNRVANYVHEADDQICLLVQVELVKGLRNLDTICATEGVDGVFIGPSDLSAALDHRGNSSHPEVQAAIVRIIDAAKRHGKAPGTLAVDTKLAQKYIEMGCTFIAVGTDLGLLARGGAELVQQFKRQ